MIFKIEDASVWRQAEALGRYTGAAVDTADGFIHLSAADQVGETLNKHFAGRTNLVLVAVESHALGDALIWEPSRGGALFPHLYADLAMASVFGVRAIPDDHALSGFADWGIET